jgi:hypothetical protein
MVHSGEYSEGRRVSGVLLGGDTQPGRFLAPVTRQDAVRAYGS